MLRNSLVIIPFNAQLKDGCDYALQTIRILARSNQVIAVVLGEPYTWSRVLKALWQRQPVDLLSLGEDGVWWFRPFMVIPGQRWLPIKKLNVWLSTWWLKGWLDRRFASARTLRRVVWFFEPFFMPIVLRVFTDFESIYDCVDRYAPLGAEAQRAEMSVKQHVDHMTVISEPLLTEHQFQRPDIVKVPLGFDDESFAAAQLPFPNQSITHQKKLVIGFCGGINYRFDFPLLFELIDRHPHHLFWFVGPQQLTLIPHDKVTAHQVKKLLSLPNVKWTPPVTKREMPALMAKMDVCLIPYDLQYEFNRYCHPMKGAEYLYLGKPIITTAIEELTQPLYEGLLMIGETASDFARHLKRLQTKGWSVNVQRRQRAAALSQSWTKKVEAVSQVLTTSSLG